MRLRSRWLTTALRLSCIAVGATLTVGPFLSLATLVVLVAIDLFLTGIVELTVQVKWHWAASLIWIAAGVTVGVWPDPTVRVVSVAVGLAMIGGGAMTARGAIGGDAVRARGAIGGDAMTKGAVAGERSTTAERLNALVSLTAGVALLTWPGVTVYVVAVAFGLSTVVSGMADAPHRDKARGLVPAIVVTLALVAAGGWIHATLPRADSFYSAPTNVPATPGVMLRSESLGRAAPAGAIAWRILYTTTRDDRTPALASALVVRASQVPSGPRPVIVWAHGATGIVPGCAPSLLNDPLGGGAMPGLDQALAKGWVVVAPDYPGLGTAGPHPFLIGQGEARSVLDAVRAAQHLNGVTLRRQTVVWGHSQGGNAALWSGILAPSYAPDVGVIGVAALAPGSELTALARIWGSKGSAIFGAYLIEAYSEAYSDVQFGKYVRAVATIPARELAGRCLSEPRIFLAGTTALLVGQSIWVTDPATGAFGDRLRQNTPTGPIPVPVLLAQGAADDVVTPTAQDAYVRGRCDGGSPVDYRTYPGRSHVGLIAPDSPLIPELVQWTQDRLDGRPAGTTCPA